MNDEESLNNLESIAIIGLAGRFPGAENINDFWQNLRDGVESISVFTNAELIDSGIDIDVLQDSNYVKAKGVLKNIELFDASFFGFNPKEAEITDPQHRFFLECAWEALESAGYDSGVYPGRIGVYAGLSLSSYLFNNLAFNQDLISSVGTYQILLSNDRDFVTTQVSYKLNLTGPSVVIQTACSTSLVAIHFACQSLFSGESDIALAGGVSITVPHQSGYLYQTGGILSPDGHCRAFDAKAQGTVGGNGVGIVVLKRLEDAIADRDCIHAVIRGSAINNDGAVKVGYTAPSVEGQAKAITEAHSLAGVEAETITYVETHGTGTILGDPIEIEALTKAFGTSTQKQCFCAIGSLKTNIGHLDAAAGVAGIIKTILALKHKLIPPSLNFEQPNPRINFSNSPFYVNTTLSPWEMNSFPRRAGVSSFGIGGTNAHVILEEAPSVEASSPSRPWQLLLFSTKTSSALETGTVNFVKHLKSHPDLNLADVAYTLQVGRQTFNHRRLLVCQDINDALTALETPDSPRVLTLHQEHRNPPIVFMFPGQGSQYVNMASELYQIEPTFQEAVDLCCELFKAHQGLDLRSVLYPSEEQAEAATQQLNQTEIAQSALFVIEYALTKLWRSWGVHPHAMIGHSIGEYVAAYLADVFSLEDAVALVAARGQLMQNLPSGSMLAVPLSVAEVQPLLDEKLSLAAINAPSLCVVSGSTEAITQLEAQLVEKGLRVRRLQTSHAFHSQIMDSILEPFTKQVKKVNLKPPKIPYVSNVTGTWITSAEATNPHYWVRHLRQTVLFVSGLQLLLEEPEGLLLEVGPGRTLSTFAKQSLKKANRQIILTTLGQPQNRHSETEFLLTTLGQLWLAGIQLDWSGFYRHEQRYRIPLPTYPFERQRYWIEPQKQAATVKIHPISLDKKPNVADWFYIPSWKQSMPPKPFNNAEMAKQRSCWLVFVDESGFGSQLVKRLEEENQDVITVKVGKQFVSESEHVYILNPRQRSDYNALLKELRTLDKIPKTIVHLWSVTPPIKQTPAGIKFFEKTQDLSFYSLLFIAQAFGEQNFIDPLQIGVISSNMQPVTGEEVLCPEKAMLLGPCKVISQEYPYITCYSIDIVIPGSKTWQEEKLVEQILSELAIEPSDSVVAYRGNCRWVQTFEPVKLQESIQGIPRLRDQGVYLITGGLGGVGGVLAEYLAQTVQAKLILIGRSTFPAKNKWLQWLKTHDDQDKVSCQIRKLQALEEQGAEVLVKSADVANLEQMQAVITQAYERFGEIHGVIHAAGIAGGGVIQLKTPEIAASVLYPKVIGARILDTIFKNLKLDFFVLCSSLNSLLGGLGQVDYCAANAFLDAFAYYRTAKDGTLAVSINWDTWQEVGMAVNSAVPIEFKQHREENLNKGILSEEGKDVFRRILCHTVPQFIVSTQDFHLSLEQNMAVTASSTWFELVPPSLSKSTHPRPSLGNAYVVPRNRTEQIVTEVWQELLGIEQVGSYDNFFELGGHSLLAIRVISQLSQVFQVEIPLNSLFEFPTVAEQAQAIAQIQTPQREDRQAFTPLPLIIPVPDQRNVPFSLTDVQQAYWIGRSSAFELGNVATHAYLEIESVGLDLERLNKSWQRLIERHDMLRSVVLPDGQQQILQQVPQYQIAVLDLRIQNPEAIASQLATIRQSMSHQVLAADQWPLFELRASILDDQHVRLHFSIDALIVDNWSLEILRREISQIYQNPEAMLAPLELSFRDYVLAEIALRNSELYQCSRDYWFSRLPKLPPGPELPLAKNPGSVTQPHFVRRSASLEPTTWLQLKNRAAQLGLTPSGVLLAAFAEVLSIWSKTPHFTLNLTLFNRLPLHPQVNDLVGDFTSLTLLVVDKSIKESFKLSAQRLQKQLWEDLEHRYISGVEVLRELTRTQGGATRVTIPVVFTSTLTQRTPDRDSSELVKLGEVVYSISQTSQVWLDHQVSEENGALVLVWDAVEELFPEGLLDDMFGAYCRLLDSLATQEEVWQETAQQLVPQAQMEQRAIVNATEKPVSEGMLHTLFAAQVLQCPHQAAIMAGDRTLTYKELYCHANQVAHRLRQLGARPNQLVAVVMEKGWEQVVAVLGILTAGSAYVPIDPDFPQERRWHIIKQGEVQLVLTQSRLDTTLEWPESVQRLSVDSLELENDYNECLEPVQIPDDLAYVIYTSGSTGSPKGVMINHRGAVNTILDVNQRFSVGANDRVLALSSLSFDLSVYDIFGTLAAGGTIVIPKTTTIKDPAHWLDLIRLLQVTIWNSVPVFMQMLVEYVAERPNKLPNTTLRLILLSGDCLPLSLPKQIKALWEDLQVVSLGGATEASIWSIFYPIAAVDPSWKSIPYGQPLTNQRFYVLNELLKSCPVWVPGKLYIGGTGLAQGYWRDDEKTAASFIIHPQTQERLYKTGDLGRYLLDGNIEFLGREDFQVKVNGYRIELGEIEVTLQQHPAVKEVVVSTVGSRENQQLVAYVVPNQELFPINQKLVEAYEPRQLEGVLLDPVERIEFKLKQSGLQEFQPTQPSIQLLKPEFDEVLTQAYLRRQSYRQFLDEPISLEKFSQFLSCLLQMKLDSYPLPKYRYPSAGNLYPVQTYLYIKPNRVQGLEAGIYYYHPANHCLVLVSTGIEVKGSFYGGNQLIFEQSAFSLFLIGRLSAITPMYGELAIDFCLLEAGYIGQLLMNTAPEQAMGLCPIGYLGFEELRDWFKLESSQVMLHSFVGGEIDLALTKQWVYPQTAQKPDSIADELRKFVQQKLSYYMLPSVYVLLNVLPLTSNGKVDRKALPVPNLVRNELKEDFVAPRTPTEEILAAFFAEILALGEIGIYDNFFELGGDSLLATKLITRSRAAFQMDLPLRSLFEKPTVAGLANCIEAFRITASELQSIADITISDREQGKL
ncbi:MAG: amino acid adenylation domain-containing protein [Rhizonema sp. PD38]|nr:amino acid adenylation domain-containing protein [Rhizonema sp. PD38]